MPTSRRQIARNLTAIVAGFTLLFLVVGAAAWLVEKQRENSNAVRHTLQIEEKLARVLSLLQDAETGQRGYLLTNEESYLEPYEEAVGPLVPALEELARSVTDNPDQARAAQLLREVAQQRVALLRQGIDLTRDSKRDAAIAVLREGGGKALMDQARDIVARMRAEEDRLLSERLTAADSTGRTLQGVMAGAILVVLALAFTALTSIRGTAQALLVARDEANAANERLLAEAAARQAVEAQNRQMQKMEAIGQLTAGVAHDFNNMLAVVISGLNLIQKRLARGETDFGAFVEGALDGAQRAATLTSRLLAFSRRQALKPDVIDANRLVTGMSDLLHRSLGEQVEIETVLAGGLWKTHADASQLENAILNLCVNARDAMPTGGKLTIETANAYLDDAYAATHSEVTAGQYVLVAVSDTGTGMTDEVLGKAFDPFFTTKGTGKGTGLGLSQVYGFVKQSGGHVKIYSEPGQGTSVKIYFPRYVGSDAVGAKTSRPVPAPGTPNEVILVVEDEERVRELSVASLRELGYTVLHAGSGADALALLECHPEVALLFTDVVMREMNGRQLAEQAIALKPDLKVIFTTGYTQNAVVHHGVVDAGAHLLMKPFTLDQLASKVRDVLNGG